jgi:polar amino acid transport system substrate-binding protein
MHTTRLALTLLGGIALAVSGCAPAEAPSAATSAAASGAPASASASPAACTKDRLALKMPGMLTVGTDNPAYAPWFSDNTPGNGKGFESAVAYAVAAKLGFAAAEVHWVTVSFNAATAPGPKTFDVDINQVSITEERRKGVDFSSGYYDVTQALVTIKGSTIAGAKSLADLAGAKLGAQVGTTSYTTITDVIKPAAKPAVFNTNDDAKLALGNGQIDGLVVDLPTALFLANADLKNGVLVGQFANAGGTPEQFGLVLDLNSTLTPCVSAAVDALRADGTLTKLEQQWLTASAGAPVLR